MGQIAEMMLDGTLCQGCGEYLGDAVGYPRRCTTCLADRGPNCRPTSHDRQPCPCPLCDAVLSGESGLQQHVRAKHPEERIACPTCGRRVSPTGLRQHQRDAGCEPAPCPHCGRRLPRSRLAQHQRDAGCAARRRRGGRP
jgi:hypothetical protein